MSTKDEAVSPRRTAILGALREAGRPLQLRELVASTNLNYGNARTALSDMVALRLVVRVNRGVYDLPERAALRPVDAESDPFQKILLNQQILKVLLNIVITNKALMEALLLGQQEIIQTLRALQPATEESEEALRNLEQIFANRVEWHFDVAAQQVVEQYTRLPAEVLDVLVAPLARESEREHLGQPDHQHAAPGPRPPHRQRRQSVD